MQVHNAMRVGGPADALAAAQRLLQAVASAQDFVIFALVGFPLVEVRACPVALADHLETFSKTLSLSPSGLRMVGL